MRAQVPAPAARRAVLAAALAIALAAVGLAAARLLAGPDRPAAAATAALPARPASWLGVYENGAPSGYQRIADFGRAAGRAPNLAGYFSGWAQPFAAGFARQARAHGAAVLVQIDPTYASVAAIAAGSYDGYLRAYAASVAAFGRPVVIGFGHEMNASWYPWGYHHVPPATFVAAWRHIVTLFRDQGAGNVTWLWTVNADLAATGPLADWWPGTRYVTWVGVDGYYYRPRDTFASVFAPTLRQVRGLTGKPVLLSETAVGPAAGQPAKIGNLFAGMRRSGVLGLVWFDNAQHDGIYHQDWRIEDHPAAVAAFRAGVAGQLSGLATVRRISQTGPEQARDLYFLDRDIPIAGTSSRSVAPGRCHVVRAGAGRPGSRRGGRGSRWISAT
jgi:glycosyl hydrolase family 26